MRHKDNFKAQLTIPAVLQTTSEILKAMEESLRSLKESSLSKRDFHMIASETIIRLMHKQVLSFLNGLINSVDIDVLTYDDPDASSSCIENFKKFKQTLHQEFQRLNSKLIHIDAHNNRELSDLPENSSLEFQEESSTIH